jgi:hypothetical protein
MSYWAKNETTVRLDCRFTQLIRFAGDGLASLVSENKPGHALYTGTEGVDSYIVERISLDN